MLLKQISALLIAYVFLFVAWSNNSSAAEDCKSPPTAMPKAGWCVFLSRFPFKRQDDPQRRVDPRVKEAMGLLNSDKDNTIRSYAFVVSVWNYHFPGVKSSELTGVRDEQPKLINFLEGQAFDEAVVLRNEEATPDLIRKILTEYYLPQFSANASLGIKTRFMFIFDGHGWQPQSPEATGALALSNLEDEGDLNYDHRFSLAELRGLLQDLSPYTQSMVALLGSCYSGSVFTGKAFAEDFAPGPSAWIATAVPGWTEAWVLPEKKGTVFFQDLISVITSWKPAGGDLAADDTGKFVNLGALTPKLREIIDVINQKHQGALNPDSGKPYPPFVTDTVAVDGKRNGAYRFIVPSATISAGPIDIASAQLTGSSVVGHPEVTIVHTPEYYKIQGVDLSRYAGDVDFKKLRAAGLRFAYLKATQSANLIDPSFKTYLESASDSGIALGAYHFFDFCLPADPQFQLIKSVVPNDRFMLPITIDFEWMFRGGTQIRPTDCSDIETIRAQLKRLLELLEGYYGSRPVIYTASSFAKSYPVLDESFNRYPLWLADYSPRSKAGAGPRLPGTNPWTFWQFTDHARVPGNPDKSFDLNAFFGTEEDFKTFASGKGNVALEAALGTTNTPQ